MFDHFLQRGTQEGQDASEAILSEVSRVVQGTCSYQGHSKTKVTRTGDQNRPFIAFERLSIHLENDPLLFSALHVWMNYQSNLQIKSSWYQTRALLIVRTCYYGATQPPFFALLYFILFEFISLYLYCSIVFYFYITIL